jgi:hypothetical protein
VRLAFQRALAAFERTQVPADPDGANAQSALAGARPGKVDRRIPYYVLEGCNHMLDAGGRCDAQEPGPGGCCPIGFACVSKRNGKVRLSFTTTTCRSRTWERRQGRTPLGNDIPKRLFSTQSQTSTCEASAPTWEMSLGCSSLRMPHTKCGECLHQHALHGIRAPTKRTASLCWPKSAPLTAPTR